MTASHFQLPLAVVGMACRLPGADSLDEFWDLLVGGRDAIGELPSHRLDRRLYHDDRKNQRAKTYTTLGGLIRERPIDLELCPLSAEDVARFDPCHVILCEVVAAACRHAGYDPRRLARPNTGVFVGHSGGSPLGGDLAMGTLAAEALDHLRDIGAVNDWAGDRMPDVIRQVVAAIEGRRTRRTANGPDVDANWAAALVARMLGLSGPQMVVDAACASGLVALALGGLALQTGSVDMAIVGGASYNKCDSLILFSQAQSCSAHASRPFDAAADGLVGSEGYVALVLKTLARARAEGDTIHAVIRGIGISSDGRGRSLWAPRKEGQCEAMRRAYAGDVAPETVQYVEAHATSTQVGDATEVEALAEFYSRGANGAPVKIPIGSVKSNLGHTLETAGLTGLLKVILAMQHARIPPTIHVHELNTTIDWNRVPLVVPREPLAWPERLGLPRRAAVNAFGIGGLNVHIVVDDRPDAGQVLDSAPDVTSLNVAPRGQVSLAEPRRTSIPRSEIAIVGRGVILPGAATVTALGELLRMGRCELSDAPPSRWRNRIGVRPGPFGTGQAGTDQVGRGASPTCRGGYIRDYSYDWRLHKIPPKQVAHANPLQFMLLDAARQAFQEAGLDATSPDRAPFDPSRTAVIVGSSFGAEFGNQLQVGLRLPEIQDELARALADHGADREVAERIRGEFERLLLEAKPALLDETGSFTASTLASRVAKTFNLMGGAMAIDAGEASSLAALAAACDLLTTGVCDHVVCAGAQRALDLASFEALALQGRLDPLDDRWLPGEGVALVVLKRLADARRDGNKILGVVSEVRARGSREFGPATLPSWTRQIGDCQAAAGIVSLIEATLAFDKSRRPHGGAGLNARSNADRDHSHDQAETISVVNRSRQGIEYEALVHDDAPASVTSDRTQNMDARPPSVVSRPDQQPSLATASIVRIGAPTPHELRKTVEQLRAELSSSADGHDPLGSRKARPEFHPDDRARLAIVAITRAELVRKLGLWLSQGDRGESRHLLEDQAIFGQAFAGPPVSPRVALLFPGQGSRYVGMLRGWPDQFPAALRTWEASEQALRSLGSPSFSRMAWEREESLDGDLWTSQASILIGDMMVYAACEEQGIVPDVVAGHSYGEFAALVAAGAWSLSQALEVTHARALAIATSRAARGGMLTLQATPTLVAGLVQRAGPGIYLSHANAPEQTVVGGDMEAIERFSRLAEEVGIASRRLAVPAAFHTPLLEDARPALARALSRAELRPPRVPLLSNVSNRYVSDPEEIRDNLTQQLVQPVRFVELIERLADDGVNVLIECGPHRVLTGLARQILAGNANVCVLAADRPSQNSEESSDPAAGEAIWRIRAALEVRGADLGSPRRQERMHAPHPLVSSAAPRPVVSEPEFFDATQRRKNQVRQRAGAETPINRDAASDPPSREACEEARPLRSEPAVARPPAGGTPSNLAFGEPLAAPAPWEPDTTNAAQIARPGQMQPRELEQFLRDFIVEQTGYPPDLIELDWDLEADLGIDSIKKAQLLGELREFFDLDRHPRASLDQFRTLRQILDFLALCPGKGDWLDARAASQDELSTSHTVTSHTAPDKNAGVAYSGAPRAGQSQPSGTQLASAAADTRNVERFLIDFVVAQTGYPEELVELDADLEADLGIDSIRKAQLLGELREQFAAPAETGDQVVLGRLKTLRQILKFLVGDQPNTGHASPRPTPPAVSEAVVQSQRPDAAPLEHADRARSNGHGPHARNGSTRLESAPDEPRRAGQIPGRADASSSRAGRGQSRPAVARLEPARTSAAFQRGRARGLARRAEIRQTLRKIADRIVGHNETGGHAGKLDQLGEDQRDELRGLAEGAGVVVDNVLALDWASGEGCVDGEDPAALANEQPSIDRVTSRHVLFMSSAPQPAGVPLEPKLHGAALILGDNRLAHALRMRLEGLGQKVFILPTGLSAGGESDPRVAQPLEPAKVVAELEAIWREQPVPHLFLVTPRDESAATRTNLGHWTRRRARGVMTPFWVCQRWLQLVTEHRMMDDASLMAATSLGGDFGFSGNVVAAEGGALAGLLKAILIESWVAGYRATPIKVIDAPEHESPATLADAMLRELAVASHDGEIAWSQGTRRVVRARREPIASTGSDNALEHLRGTTWVCTGGARGITAFVVEEMARRWDLRVHLLGTAPAPHVPADWRDMDEASRKQLKLRVMAGARGDGQSPIKAWEAVEKAIEIDATLRRLREQGISAEYHACDVADREALRVVLDRIRAVDGRIDGILHGAGVGKDARFDRKEPARVDQCLRAKVDGAWALMELTSGDALRYFVAFGSISGRFGANGHTDYSLANDMLAKQVDWYRGQRPDVRAALFHWHAWGDVGMATKPETRLALEMIGMKFMPAREGLMHLLNEMAAGLPTGEVLITDDHYYRIFYPAETLQKPGACGDDGGLHETEAETAGRTEADAPASPLLDEGTTRDQSGWQVTTLSLDPTREVFLREHRLDDRPLLPIVVGLEMLGEAARKATGMPTVFQMREIEAVQGLKFFQERPQEIRVVARVLEPGIAQCEVRGDFLARDGRLVERDRVYLRAIVDTTHSAAPAAVRASEARHALANQSTPPSNGVWEPIEYAPRGSKFHLGPPLRCLRRIQAGTRTAWGRISAPALAELAGTHRDVATWIVPSAALDACLYATGLLAWMRVRPGPTLPSSCGALRLYRLPSPGEACVVEATHRDPLEGDSSDRAARNGNSGNGGWHALAFDFRLYGSDGGLLLEAEDYRVVPLGS